MRDYKIISSNNEREHVKYLTYVFFLNEIEKLTQRIYARIITIHLTAGFLTINIERVLKDILGFLHYNSVDFSFLLF